MEVRKVRVISDNGDEDDDNEGFHSLKVKELKLLYQSYEFPISGTKPVLIDRILRQMNALQATVETEANVGSGSDDVLEDGADFDALNE